MSEPYYITTAIAYPNGKPHIGHAYEAIATDAIARFQRLMGRDVRFITGTDEHGLKMVQTARAVGRDTLEFADEMSSYFRDMCDKLNISYTGFMRTSDPAHHAASQALWLAMEASGDLYPDRYEGYYSVRDEAFYDEKELIDGEGGEKLSPQGTPVEWTVEETWFFRLSKYQDRLLELYAANPQFIQPDSRRNEVMRFVEGGSLAARSRVRLEKRSRSLAATFRSTRRRSPRGPGASNCGAPTPPVRSRRPAARAGPAARSTCSDRASTPPELPPARS